MKPPTHVLGRRVAAFLIDVVLVGAVCAAVFFAVDKTGPPGTTGPSPYTGSPGLTGQSGFSGPTGFNEPSGFNAHATVSLTIDNREHYLTGGPAALFILFSLVVVVLVFALLAAWWGGTPGMRLLGLRVVGADGGRVNIGRHLLRTLMWLADGFPYVIPGGVAFVCALTNPRRQRIGDLAAQTLVVARDR